MKTNLTALTTLALTLLLASTTQLYGDNSYELLVTDGRGEQQRVSGRGRYVVGTLQGVFSGSGISQIEVVDVGGVGMPLFVARILFSQRD